MKVLSMRFCSTEADCDPTIAFFEKLGLPTLEMPAEAAAFPGKIFTAGESWLEFWKEGPGMEKGIMLQIIVDDAEAFVKQAKDNGLDAQGPMEMHGERVYFFKTPSGMPVSVNQKL